MTSLSLEMLKTVWARFQAACSSNCACSEQEVGLETSWAPAHPHVSTNSRGPAQPLFLSWAKRAQEALVLNCLSHTSLPGAAMWHMEMVFFDRK